MNGLALCAGYAGLELGLKLLFGDAYRVVCYVEREAFDAATLVARMEDSCLDRAPVWDDLTTFDGRPWRGLVDCITAGFPCQPWSQAGLRRRVEDPRWLWPTICRLIRVVRPSSVFLENVTGLFIGGIAQGLGDLAEIGFDAEWGVFSAAQLSAPHERQRVFILAYARSYGSERSRRRRDLDEAGSSSRREARQQQRNGNAAEHSSADVAYSDGRQSRPRHIETRRGGATPCRYEEADRPAHSGAQLDDSRAFTGDGGLLARPRQEGNGEADPRGASVTLGNASSRGREERCFQIAAQAGPRQPADAGCRLRAFPPERNDFEGWREYLEVHPGLEPSICRGADGLAYRLDRIAATGNGVVPVVAAYAYATLASRFES